MFFRHARPSQATEFFNNFPYQIQPDISHHNLILLVHIHDLLKRKSKLWSGNLWKLFPKLQN